MGGGNIAYGLNCRFFPFVEASYLPGVLRTVNIPTGATTSYQQFNVNMTDFHGGLHIRVPLPESRVLPYAVVGLGLIRGSSSTGTVYLVGPYSVVPFSQTIPSSTNFAVNFGAGLRFFFSERFAVRVEFKGFKPTSAPTPLDPRIFYRFAIGPVFQLR
jgi:opacity protein-like surface antigen